MKIKLFDRFLANPEEVSCGCDDGENSEGSVCCAPGTPCSEPVRSDPESLPYVTGMIDTPAGRIPRISTRLTQSDRTGAWRVRWGIGRMTYTVPPGLYAFGAPDSASPVFVSANYKLSFDRLRTSLNDRSGWILVLDTKGINVWCAAGKGTFGTEELLFRMEAAALSRVVSHRRLVLPQLGAPGIAAHTVTRSTGFKVAYGPVRADDLNAFLDAGMKATADMRRIRFRLRDRAVLAPVELMGVLRHRFFLALLGIWVLSVLGLRFLSFDLPALLGAVVVGTAVVPLLLPWIPGRAFAVKGWLLGLIWAAAALYLHSRPDFSTHAWLDAASYMLILPALSAFLAMNFTGASTITSLSGVVKEMRTAVPLILISVVLGIAAYVTGLLFYG